MNNLTIFINNVSAVMWLMFAMCFIGVASFLIWKIIHYEKKEIYHATGKDWIDELFEDTYFN